MKKAFIETRALTKTYRSGKGVLNAVDSVDLSLDRGEITAILGPSGSGKSTLLNLVGGIDTASGGSITVGELEVSALGARKLGEYRRNKVGFVFQFYNLIPNLTSYENIEVVSDICASPLDIDELMEALNIAELKKRYPVELSGGQQQRVAIACAVVKNPELLLCDEPTGALDYKSSLDILALLRRVNEKYGTTILIITHNSAITGMCERVIRFRDGAIEEDYRNDTLIPVSEISW